MLLIVLGSASGVALSQDAIVTTRSITFPKTNSSHLKMGRAPKVNSSSKDQFSGAEKGGYIAWDWYIYLLIYHRNQPFM